MKLKTKTKPRVCARNVKYHPKSTSRGVTGKSVFCPNPTAQTPGKALSQEQRELLRINQEAVSASGDAVGKYRAAAQFIRMNLTKLVKTENRLPVSGGLCKSAASEIVLVAVHSTEDVFLQWMKGEIGFRGVLKEAKALKVAKANGRPKQRLAKEDQIN
jgi:hypothetical protein